MYINKKNCKELYDFNRDDFCRKKYIRSIAGVIHCYSFQTLKFDKHKLVFNLFWEGIKISKNIKEIIILCYSLLPIPNTIKNILYKLIGKHFNRILS